MVKIGITEGSHFLKTVKDGAVRIIKQVLSGTESKESIQATFHGLDSVTPANCNVINTTTERNESIALAIIDYLNRKATTEGETRLYATSKDGKELLYDIYLKENGTCVFAEGESPAVAFDRLKEEFDELNDKFNDLVKVWNTFADAYTPGSPSVTGLPPTAERASSSEADIDNASSENILIP